MTLTEMLERRHTLELEWWEPWPAAGPEGNELDAHVRSTATVHHCVNMQRKGLLGAERAATVTDQDLLGDFIAIHWARPVRPPSPVSPWIEIRNLLEDREITIAPGDDGTCLWIGIGDEHLKVGPIRAGRCPELDQFVEVRIGPETPDHEGGSLL